MKIEVTKDPTILGLPSALVKLPVIVRVVDFDSTGVKTFSKEMAEAHDSGQPVIPIVISSYGGEVYSLLSMISEIQNARVPVATVLEGHAMSCGAILFSFGSWGYRYMAPEATLMIHEVAKNGGGKNSEIQVDAKQTDLLNKKLLSFLDTNTGHPDGFFSKALHDREHADFYLNAVEAQALNLTNHIGVPSYKVSLKHTVEFG